MIRGCLAGAWLAAGFRSASLVQLQNTELDLSFAVSESLGPTS